MRKITTLASALAIALIPVSALAQDSRTVAVDPARLAAAKVTVDHIFPTGTYARIMNGSMNKMMDSIMGGVGKLPLRDIAAIGGLQAEDVEKLGEGTLEEIMTIYDPAYHERMSLGMKAMMAEMSKIMTQFEPGIRDGLASAYANRFTTQQLGELNGFFSTPTGKLYASESMTMFMDPEVMAKMQAFVPQLMQQMPQIVQKVEAVTAGLPKPRKLDDLSAAERAKLAKLLGVSEENLGKHSH